ncbi:MAG: leucine-rich repeat domain-containing protein [Bacteroidales bacterium]|nr:leucine-rich repeat domain-containing protein [Bacteroidales bacterium]MBQ9311725.1 leucine-rich repeat domain-containing protein [Bacteroidales bacterium]
MRKKFFLSIILSCCLSICYSQSLTCYSLEEALENKDSVATLILKKKKLKEFPMEILDLKNLQRLDISRNYIKELPKEIVSLQHLHYINAAQNLLSFLPKEMAQMQIDTLILWDNMIREFDEDFKNLNLKYLDLRAIQMTRKEQKAIKSLFPKTRIRKDHPCNCGSRKEN